MNLIDIVFASILASNLFFFQFLGLGEFLVDHQPNQVLRKTAVLGLLLVTAALAFWLGDRFLLIPWHLEFLRSLLLLAVLWAVTSLYSSVQKALPGTWPAARLFVVHSFLVGAILLTGASSSDPLEVVTAAVAVSLGYGGSLVLLDTVFVRLDRERIPVVVQGLPLKLVTLGLVWLFLHGLGFAFAGKGA